MVQVIIQVKPMLLGVGKQTEELQAVILMEVLQVQYKQIQMQDSQ
jgi:hypothetical protein